MIGRQEYVLGLGIVIESTGDLVTNVRELGDLISPRDEAGARLYADFWKTKGTRVSMTASYLKGECPVLVRDGMSLELAENLIQVNSSDGLHCTNSRYNYYCTKSSRQYEQARKIADSEEKSGLEPQNRKAMLCPSRESFSMSPTENQAQLAFILQDLASQYLGKNRKPIIFSPVDLYVVDNAGGTIQNYIWFRSLDEESGLVSSNTNAGETSYRTRGVKLKVQKLAEIVRDVRQGKLPVSQLDGVEEYLIGSQI